MVQYDSSVGNHKDSVTHSKKLFNVRADQQDAAPFGNQLLHHIYAGAGAEACFETRLYVDQGHVFEVKQQAEAVRFFRKYGFFASGCNGSDNLWTVTKTKLSGHKGRRTR